MAENHSISVTIDAGGTIDRLWPLMEQGLVQGVVTVDEAADLLVEAIIASIEVENG